MGIPLDHHKLIADKGEVCLFLILLLPAVNFPHHALQRREYECEWGTQFVADVRKEAQFHLCQLHIHLMLLFFLLASQIVAGDAAHQ